MQDGHDADFPGYDTSAGSYLPVELVDAVEEEELQNAIKKVQSDTSGLSLKEYQIHVLVSRAYNAGTGYDFGTGNGFVEAYKKYWDEDTDGEYGKKPTNEIYEKDFFKNYMTKPNTSEGAFVQGLQNRREREWKLFVCGYYDFGGKGDNVFWSEPSSSSGEKGKEVPSNTKGIKGTYTSASTGKTYTEYYQNVSGVDWYSKVGCFHNSMATIISGYGVNKTPNQLSGWNGGNCNGDRSDFSTIGKCSYKENKSPTASAMKTALKNGHTLMIHIEGKTLKTDNGSNSYSGHWVVVLDYKTTNNKDKIYIHNPWKGNACGWADLNTVASALSEYIDVWK